MLFSDSSRRAVRAAAVVLGLLAAPLSLSAKTGVVANDACAADGTCCKGEANEICVHENDPPISGYYWQGVAGKCGVIKDE